MTQVDERAHDAASYTKTYWLTPAETETQFKDILFANKLDHLENYRAITRAYEGATGQPTNKLVPVLSSISPTTKVAGAAAFVLTATGSNFAPGAQINWGGQYLKTTYVSSTTLTADIPATLVQSAATVPVKVYVDSDVSATQTFTITATVREGEPEESWLKAEIVAWLVDKGVPEEDTHNLTKAELLELVP